MERLVGRKAPDFKMNSVLGDGSEFKEVKLSDYNGKWLVMFFYPLDFTFVCPTEITGFSKRADEFRKMNAELLSVSIDSEYSHQAWIKNGLGEINFPMASDITKQVAKEYGTLIEEQGVSLRGLFIIDPEGYVKYSVVHDLNVGRSVDETLRVLKALQSGGLCPIDWQEGDKHL
ncbi:MAG: peroxiredoxin [Clostridium argentinense]|uniref:Peroxiredoxin n=1 Tax=Clostridium faecium TaxID=2762223 RepID=A0ABR8YVU4_9CLOT|nr:MULTISPECIES: peroxiredoxin [Clostridium]MBD8048071.1 peroxiredoxin [Clostridium faecium]MBS5825464.1 peroxiredoxin [Clostridium argentinense]MDU1350093.1 peroxiredoxin [Clostridium argentinense]